MEVLGVACGSMECYGGLCGVMGIGECYGLLQT